MSRVVSGKELAIYSVKKWNETLDKMKENGANFKYITLKEARKLYPEPKRDKLGRRNKGWGKAGPGRGKGSGIYSKVIMVRIDDEMYKSLKSKGNMSQQIREFIEWGLENG